MYKIVAAKFFQDHPSRGGGNKIKDQGKFIVINPSLLIKYISLVIKLD